MGIVEKGRRKERKQDHPARPGATPFQPASGQHGPRAATKGGGQRQKTRRGLNAGRPKKT